MGMTDIRTNAYKENILSFEKSIDQDDYEAAVVAYKELEILLHPDNHLRKLLKFQLMSVKGESSDQVG